MMATAKIRCKVGDVKSKLVKSKIKDGTRVQIIQEVDKVKTVIAQGIVKIEGAPETHDCKENAHWDEALQKCVCDAGFQDKDGKCVPDTTHECPEPNSHWDGTTCVCDEGFHDEGGKCVSDTAPPPPPPPPPPHPVCPPGQHLENGVCVPDVVTPPPTGDVLWDSNRDGKWNDGRKRTVAEEEGNVGANGKGIYTAASGDPKLVVDGDGVAHLVTGSGECEDLSLKLRSRHQEGGACANRFGGFGCSIDRKSIGMKTESCHNNHENSKSVSGISIKNNEWHKVRFTCKDGTNAVNFELFLDGVSKMKHSHKNPAAAFVDKAKFAQNSYFWIRSNNSDHGRIYVCATHYDAALELEFKFDGGNSVGLKNVKLLKL